MKSAIIMSMQPLVVGIRFAEVGKSYHFDASSAAQIKVGDRVVVETSRGKQLGEVVQIVKNATPPPEGWKPIERIATPRDLILRRTWAQKEVEAMIACRERAAQLKLHGVKVVAAEYSFDGTRLTFMFSTESEDKADLKSLRHDMQKQYQTSQVDMRQIGPRCGENDGRHGRLWTGDTLLLQIPDRVQSHLHQNGQGAGYFPHTAGNYRHVRAPALLPGLRI